MANKIFVDLDGPLVAFDDYVLQTGKDAEKIKYLPGSYAAMKPVLGAIQAVRELASMGYEMWVATKPPTGFAPAYQEKAQWVFDNLPELTRRLIITPDKGLLGDEEDFLIDDRPHKANCQNFPGTLIVYSSALGWPDILAMFRMGRDSGWGQNRISSMKDFNEDFLIDGLRAASNSFEPIEDDPEYCRHCGYGFSCHYEGECCDPNTNEKEDLMAMQRMAERRD